MNPADNSIIEKAKEIAHRAHSGQTRRDGVTPYIHHPEAVVSRLSGEHPHVIATAWLHDVIEDTAETATTLLEAGIPKEVVEAVVTLTKTDWMDYPNYLDSVHENPIARKVKVADMLANLADSPTPRQIRKYAKGLLFLVQ